MSVAWFDLRLMSQVFCLDEIPQMDDVWGRITILPHGR